MASINSLPEGKYNIDPDSKTAEILDTIKSEFSTYDSDTGKRTWVNDKVKEEYDYLEKALKNVDDEGSRKYIISKRLGMVPEFSHNNLPMLDEYRDLKWQEDFKSPTWDNIDKIEPGFFDPKSPNYFGKMPKETLAMYQKKMGIDDANSFWNRASEEEVKRTRHKIAHGEDEGGWFDSPMSFAHNLGGATLSLVSPRVQEAIERGEDPTLKDYALDATENAAYTYMPIGKALRPVGKVASYFGTNVGNPLAMEALDALVYGDESNSDRKKFSTGDVGTGSIINMGMGVIGNKFKGGEKYFNHPDKMKIKIGNKDVELDVNLFRKLREDPEFQKNIQKAWRYNKQLNGAGDSERLTARSLLNPSERAVTPSKSRLKEMGISSNDALKLYQQQELERMKLKYPDWYNDLQKADREFKKLAEKGVVKYSDAAKQQIKDADTYLNKLNLAGKGEGKLGVGSFVSNKAGDEANKHKQTRDFVMKRGINNFAPGTARLIYPLMNWEEDISNKDKLEQLLGNY